MPSVTDIISATLTITDPTVTSIKIGVLFSKGYTTSDTFAVENIIVDQTLASNVNEIDCTTLVADNIAGQVNGIRETLTGSSIDLSTDDPHSGAVILVSGDMVILFSNSMTEGTNYRLIYTAAADSTSISVHFRGAPLIGKISDQQVATANTINELILSAVANQVGDYVDIVFYGGTGYITGTIANFVPLEMTSTSQFGSSVTMHYSVGTIPFSYSTAEIYFVTYYSDSPLLASATHIGTLTDNPSSASVGMLLGHHNVVVILALDGKYIYSYSSGQYTYFSMPCLAKGTLVTMWDRTQKKIEDIAYNDKLLVWDFETGKQSWSMPLWIKVESPSDEYNLIKFSDGTQLKTIADHRIYNLKENKFTYAMYESPVGTKTIKEDGSVVTIVSKEVIRDPVSNYNIKTKNHINLYANGILTSSRYNNALRIKDMKFQQPRISRGTTELFSGVPPVFYTHLNLWNLPSADHGKNHFDLTKAMSYMKKYNVIFLDHTGVMRVVRNHGPFDNQAVHLLRDFFSACTNTDTYIVVSSDWKYTMSLEQLQEMYSKYGLPLPIDTTPNLWTPELTEDYACTRLKEINKWLSHHEGCINSYVIIDDLNINDPVAIHVNPEIGLTNSDIHRATEILSNNTKSFALNC